MYVKVIKTSAKKNYVELVCVIHIPTRARSRAYKARPPRTLAKTLVVNHLKRVRQPVGLSELKRVVMSGGYGDSIIYRVLEGLRNKNVVERLNDGSHKLV